MARARPVRRFRYACAIGERHGPSTSDAARAIYEAKPLDSEVRFRVDTRLVILEPAARPCPGCGQRGTAVQLQTVKALLTEVALRRIQLTHYRFCDDDACDVVYFGDAGDRFAAGDIRVPVWQKQRPGARLLCYCFAESETVIRDEVLRSGRAEAVDRIRDHIAAQRCACDIRNPRGTCCLGDVMAAVARIEAEVSEGRDDRWSPHERTGSVNLRTRPAFLSRRSGTTRSVAC